MRDISRNKTTQKYKPLINASTLPLNEKNRVVRPIGPNIKGTICGLIISTAWCQFIISATKIYPCNKFLYQHCKILIAVLLTILIRLMTSSAKFESVFVYLLLLCTIAVNRFTVFFYVLKDAWTCVASNALKMTSRASDASAPQKYITLASL